MLFIQVCVGSSCHLKGSADIVELLRIGAFSAADDEHGVAFTGKLLNFLLARFRNITYCIKK